MENKCCCAFGHREAYGLSHTDLLHLLERLIVEEGVEVFMTGNMGDFDRIFIESVCRLRKVYPKISLVLVKPCFSKRRTGEENLYPSVFDEVLIPEESAGAHYKAAIKLRNRWMIEHCDLVVTYVYRDFGGSFEAMQYAEKKNKKVFNITETVV